VTESLPIQSIAGYFVIIRIQLIQIAFDLFECKADTHSILLYASISNAAIGRIKGDMNSCNNVLTLHG